MYSGPSLAGFGVSGQSLLSDGRTSNADLNDFSDTADGGSPITFSEGTISMGIE